MTNKQRVLDTIAFKKTDRIPFAVLNGQGWICARRGMTAASMLELPDAGAQMLVDEYNNIGSEIFTSGCAAAWPMISAMGGKVEMNALAAEILERPAEELSELRKWSAAEIIEKMRKDYYYGRTLVQMKKMREIVGDETMIGGGFFGPFTITAQMIGVENFMMELMDADEEDIEYALNMSTEIVAAYLDDLVDNGMDLVTVPEPVASGDLIRPDAFEKYVMPYDIRVREHVAARCPAALIHVCGKTQKLVSIVADKRYGVFSVDSIDMVKAQQDATGRIALFGDLNPAAVLSAKSADEVYKLSRELCAQMKPFGGFILAPGCDLAPAIPLENLQAMARAARES